MDKRKTNYKTGKENEDNIYNLLNTLKENKIININLEKKGGRKFNYDLLINNYKMEIKNNSDSIFSLPEILQLGCTNIDKEYIKYHYEKVIKPNFKDINYEDYLKNINSVKHEGIFEIIDKNKDKIEDLTKIEIVNYLKNNDKIEDVINKIIDKLEEQLDKYFLLCKKDDYKIEKINDNFDYCEYKIINDTIIIYSKNHIYKCLLRWKNHIGVNYPAYQISIKNKKENKKEKPKLTKSECKKQGIYFTPLNIVDNILSKLKDYKFNKILEPSCGDGSFLNELIKLYPNSEFKAYELNDKIYDYISNIYDFIIKEDYLKSEIDEKFDLIIGNPPFYITKNKIHNEYYTGRPNIFIQFIIHSLFKLNENGILCFIIPETFLNCVYYLKTRLLIKNNFEIINIFKNPDDFKDTKYNTITIIIKNNKKDNNEWFYNDIIIYDEELKNMMKLKHFKFNDFKNIEIKIGNFVWNQNRELIKNDNKNLPVLIYNPNNEKRSFINTTKFFNFDCIIINRGYGVNYKFDFELIKSSDFPNGYLLENHIIYIKGDIKTLNEIYKLLNSENTKKFIKLYITNGALNLNDFNNLLLFE